MGNRWEPLLEINGIRCNLFTGDDGADTIAESSGDFGFKAIVRFKCIWRDRNELRRGLLGSVGYVDGAIIRQDPYDYPVAFIDDAGEDGPGLINAGRCIVTAVPEVRGLKWVADITGNDTGRAGWGGYEYAILTAEFTTPPWLSGRDSFAGAAYNDLTRTTYCVSKLRVSGEVFSPPTGSYKWKEGTFAKQPVKDAHVGLIRPRYELSVTRIRMPIVPCVKLDSMIGTVNETTVKVGENTVSPDAAMFMGYNAEPYNDPYNGRIVFNVELLWLINGFIVERNADGNWNWFVDPGGSWSEIVSNADVANPGPPFGEAEHNDLFSNTIA